MAELVNIGSDDDTLVSFGRGEQDEESVIETSDDANGRFFRFCGFTNTLVLISLQIEYFVCLFR